MESATASTSGHSSSISKVAGVLGRLISGLRHYSSAPQISNAMRKRELLNEARALVPEGSGWLEAYTRNISPRQLTWRLGKRDSLAAMTEGWQLYQGKFDTVAMAALLRRLRHAQLQDPGFDPLAAQRLLDDLVPRLRSVGLRFGKLRDITAYLHALAKLRSPAPSASSSAASPRAGAAAASLLTQPDALVLDLAVFATRNRTELLHASPQRLATLLWALMRLLPPQLYGSEQLQVRGHVCEGVGMCVRGWACVARAWTRA